ncbi:acyl-CoA dehydrogenase [Nocardioides sp. S5]|uniref:acyl-CoA dehydrogenase family protein n=1 Tax=Nocardioides sp. S5 TaxID=2017486 RepID=UPI001A8D9C9E|nr:acyl-CoA dehydrogenase family protein [Nocardioides sp. S5]QSR32207.1 acyl-CoA dehydrogenase [Nocardioides sp. S5]
MLSFSLNPDQEEMRKVAAEFARREIEPRWREADEKAEFPLELLSLAYEQGLMGIAAPTSLGGLGLGATEEVIFTEEMAKVNPNLAVGLILQGSLAPSILWNFASQEQQQEFVPPVLRGEKILAMAITEPTAGSDVSNVRTTARRNGPDTWLLSGEKCFITLGEYAQQSLVLARTDEAEGIDGMRFFIVDTDAPGFRVKKMDMWANRPAPTSQLFLQDVEVPESRRLDAGFREIMATFNKERILVAARWLGHSQHAFSWAMEYATTREQFGKRIGDFQSIAFQFADAHVAIEAVRWLTYRAAWMWDEGLPIKDLMLDVSAAKLLSTQTAEKVSQMALHIGGGWGLVKDELPVARMAIDAFIAPVTVGSYEVQKRIIARKLGLRTE